MAKVNTEELIGIQLEYAIAICMGMAFEWDNGAAWVYPKDYKGWLAAYRDGKAFSLHSQRWTEHYAHGGPIIDQAGIATRRHSNGTWHAMHSSDLGDSQQANWISHKIGERYGQFSYQVHRIQVRFLGPTRLIAAFRCFVASFLGEEVEIPEVLA